MNKKIIAIFLIISFSFSSSCSSQNDNIIIINETKLPQEGCISGNCQNGIGTFIWKNGNMYQGQWENGKREGGGTMTWLKTSAIPERDKKEKNRKKKPLTPIFDFRNFIGRANGMEFWGVLASGIYFYSYLKNEHKRKRQIKVLDDKYIGQWQDNQMHGKGTLYLRPNHIIEGKWRNGIYIGK